MNSHLDRDQQPPFAAHAAERILVVEDNARNRLLIEAILKAVGYTNIEHAVDGLDGLEKANAFRPDIIILDIMMPKMDGFEFMVRLRDSTELGTTPILVQTALNSSQERNKIYASGATDMLSKPISSGELVTRVRTHLELRRLTKVFESQLRLQAELDTARSMQEALLPPQKSINDIKQQTGLSIESAFETCSELGGDLWGVHVLDANRLGVFTIDFSGHGYSASLNTFRLHTIMSHNRPDDGDPGKYMALLNNELNALLPTGQYATMFYGIIDTQIDSLIYSAAAAPFPIIGEAGNTEMTFLETHGVPLGMKAGTAYENRTVAFSKKAYLFMYSDALIETPNDHGDALEDDTLKQFLTGAMEHAPLGQIVPSVVERFHQRASTDLQDDLTVVLISRHINVSSVKTDQSNT